MGTSIIEAVAKEKCPRCRQGNLFTSPAYSPKKFHEMHEDCSECGLHFELEPGFFYGAMYISYGISVGLLLVIGTIIFLTVKDAPLWIYLVSIASVPIIFLPFIFRVSRVIFLYIFGGIGYQANVKS